MLIGVELLGSAVCLAIGGMLLLRKLDIECSERILQTNGHDQTPN